ncbi:hypothetical protein CUJ83_09655 [Methanocella sp. CWC-04]|uniref:UPF0251 protein CUJ83_09655 n=1 Tax=Methanooceanicella nereidis TaxID=2052831 RepID=A0AAP2RD66_9EURY|nr:DUF134 domain-containing protein [Methanocella sp. CWC-04]MCD1295263.1 hypothetical protein [Methanocella sp. CWC-04]
MVNKVKRRVSCLPKATYYKPREIPLCNLDIINLSIEELEAIRLCDLLQVDQNEAADKMGISRKTFWTDLQKARKKVADALVNGKAIKISGGDYVKSGDCVVEFVCENCSKTWNVPDRSQRPERCPHCSSIQIYRKCGDGKGKRIIDESYCCPKDLDVNEKEDRND